MGARGRGGGDAAGDGRGGGRDGGGGQVAREAAARQDAGAASGAISPDLPVGPRHPPVCQRAAARRDRRRPPISRLTSLLQDGVSRHESWFRLFKRMDDDGSGRVSYAELEELVRHELQLPPSQLPEHSLKAVWVALDEDGSGYITVREFGQFMRKGAAAKDKEHWRERLEARKRAQGDEVRALLEQRDLKRALEGVVAASDAQLSVVAALLHARMRQLFSQQFAGGGDGARHDNWFRLFKHMDDDNSGRVSYAELEDLVRQLHRWSRKWAVHLARGRRPPPPAWCLPRAQAAPAPPGAPPERLGGSPRPSQPVSGRHAVQTFPHLAPPGTSCSCRRGSCPTTRSRRCGWRRSVTRARLTTPPHPPAWWLLRAEAP